VYVALCQMAVMLPECNWRVVASSAILVAGVGIMPLNTKGFKDTATHDFMFKTSRADADSLPISMKVVVLMSHYVRVYLLNFRQLCI